DPKSTNSASATHSHSQPVTPIPGFHRRTYTIEVKGRKARPSRGTTKVLNARSTNGVKIHTRRNATLGAETRRRANKHAMGVPPAGSLRVGRGWFSIPWVRRHHGLARLVTNVWHSRRHTSSSARDRSRPP